MEQTIETSVTYVESKTQWQLIWRQFTRHRMALASLVVLSFLYVVGVFSPEFFAPHSVNTRFDSFLPPQGIHFVDAEGDFHLRPFVYGWKKELDRKTFKTTYTPDTSQKYPIRFLVQGSPYKLWGIIPSSMHFIGVDEGGILCLWGTDNLGRDMFSRSIFALRISLTIGLVGVFISLVLGLIIGGVSGLVGGPVDNVIQRFIEVIMSIPTIPLWMALAAAVPREWSAVQVYFAITVILSLVGWTGLARVVRSKFISLREMDFVTAAEGYNASQMTIIIQHLIPNFLSYVVVNLTLAIPDMILAETSLSFLGLGLRPPTVSLGVLLSRAQDLQTVAMHPWLLIPGALVVIVVLAFNFVGDGLRDAADPYQLN
ncbi:MAG: ABC transporter permease [Firmicutes bacterium]|nr:ABC transporter permease [Bacillota bacterium]